MSEKQDRQNARDTQTRLSDAMKIFGALSAVDEELLERSEGAVEVRERKVIPFWRYNKVIAACFCLAVVGTALYAGVRFVAAPYSAKSTKMESAYDEAAADAVQQNMAEAEECAPEDTVNQATMTQEDAKQDGGEAVTAEKFGVGAQGSGESGADGITQNLEVEDGEQINHTDVGSKQESKDEFEIAIAEKSPNEMTITEKEARETEKLGNFIPTALPAGYRFESAYRIDEDGVTKDVHLCWLNGMDSIMLTVTDIGEEMNDGSAQKIYPIAEVSRPETYDEHLYEIPYAETVPNEYWQIFNDPVFVEEDFTIDIVKARMKTYEDQGDTDTPRGMFGVLYEDGILVRFNGRGSVEEIWRMFQSIGQSSKD